MRLVPALNLLILAACLTGIGAYWVLVLDFPYQWWADNWERALRHWRVHRVPPPGALPPGMLASVYWAAGIGVFVWLAGWRFLHGSGTGRISVRRTRETVHGDARWARRRDIRKAGLFSSEGAVVGGWPNGAKTRILRHDGPEHVLAFAPTRTGKGVGLVVPTLLEWKHSALVLDIKAENFEKTAGWRAKELEQGVFRFDPASEEQWARYNPLAEVRMGTPRAVGDAEAVAVMIMDPAGKGLKDYWAQAGYDWLKAAVLHVLEKARMEGSPPPSLADVKRHLEAADTGAGAMVDKMLGFDHRDPAVGERVRGQARVMKDRAEKERSGVLNTVVAKLGGFDDPLVARNTSASDFKLTDLVDRAAPATVYLVVSPKNQARLRPLLRVFFNQVLTRLLEDVKEAEGRGRLLLMLDEFASLGKLESFEDAISKMAGYGFKAYTVVQNLGQLRQAYGPDESVTSNSDVRVAYTPNDLPTAEQLSKWTGDETWEQAERTPSRKRGELAGGDVTERKSLIGRPLMSPDQAMRMPKIGSSQPSRAKRVLSRLPGLGLLREARTEPGEMLIFASGRPAVRGRQFLYFQDREFLRRSLIAPPGPKPSTESVRAGEEKKDSRQEDEDSVSRAKAPEKAAVSGAEKPEQKLRLGLRLGLGSGAKGGAVFCALPDLPDEPETLALMMAPPAVSWSEGSLRVHLGERSWSLGPMAPGNAEAFRFGRGGEDDQVLCEPAELGEALGLDGIPRPARLARWRADRVSRGADGGIVHWEKITEGPEENVSGEEDSPAPFPDYAAALAAAERGEG